MSWYGANAYGLWAHGRDWANYKSEGFLPTEAQWEYAARGSEFRDFPWGSGAEPGQLNVARMEGMVRAVVLGRWWVIGPWDLVVSHAFQGAWKFVCDRLRSPGMRCRHQRESKSCRWSR